MDDLSVYIHIPFCVRRCGYCDFNTYAGMGHLIPRYVGALSREIEIIGSKELESGKSRLLTVYFGGGTPSLLSPYHFEQIFQAVQSNFDLAPDIEVTIEANPGQVSEELLNALRNLGVNRISLGVQSSNQAELKALDRLHGYPDAVKAVEMARLAGFDNISLDLIFGIPHQTIQSWQKSLTDLLALSPEHLSLYSLTVEEGTPLFDQVAVGHVEVPEDDLAAEMYELAREVLASRGYDHYEISNWALSDEKDRYISRHNRQYWRNEPYLGLGAGAHGFNKGVRYENLPGLLPYISRLEAEELHDLPFPPAAAAITEIDRYTEMQETMMLGLRLLREGVSAGRFLERFGVEMDEVFGAEIEKFLGQGLVEWVNRPVGRLRLTERGYLLGNQVFGEFV